MNEKQTFNWPRMLISAVAFVQDIKLFSSAPKEAREVLVPRESELFKGARGFISSSIIFLRWKACMKAGSMDIT